MLVVCMIFRQTAKRRILPTVFLTANGLIVAKKTLLAITLACLLANSAIATTATTSALPDAVPSPDLTAAASDTTDFESLDIFLENSLISADDIEPVLDTPDLYALLQAEFAADRGEIEQALSIYKAESFKKNATNVFERALGLSLEFESPQDSLSFATAWQSRNPEHLPAWFYITHLALKAGEYTQAAAMLSTILHYDPTSNLDQILNGIIPNKIDDQQALFDALRSLEQDNASISILRAGLLMRLGDPKAALLHVNHALKLEPKNLAFITLKLDILRTNNQFDELWQYLHQVRKELPKEKDLYLYEIRHLIASGDLPEAWELLQLANKHTNHADVILLSGLVALDLNRFDDAIQLLKPLIELPEFANQAHYYTAIGYERLGNHAKARKHYERVSSYDLVLDARTKAMGIYLLENNPEAAILSLVRLRDEFEAYATDSYLLQAEIYLKQGDKKNATDLLTIANREYPDDDRLLYASYQLLESELGDDDKRLALDKLLQIDPLNPSYQLADAKLRLTMDSQDVEALQIAQEISSLTANDPNYDSQLQLDALLVLGKHALATQNYDAVIEYLQTPYDVVPNLEVGITLLRAYQGLDNQEMVDLLLSDLQARFGNNDNNNDTAPSDSQIY